MYLVRDVHIPSIYILSQYRLLCSNIFLP